MESVSKNTISVNRKFVVDILFFARSVTWPNMDCNLSHIIFKLLFPKSFLRKLETVSYGTFTFHKTICLGTEGEEQDFWPNINIGTTYSQETTVLCESIHCQCFKNWNYHKIILSENPSVPNIFFYNWKKKTERFGSCLTVSEWIHKVQLIFGQNFAF